MCKCAFCLNILKFLMTQFTWSEEDISVSIIKKKGIKHLEMAFYKYLIRAFPERKCFLVRYLTMCWFKKFFVSAF